MKCLGGMSGRNFLNPFMVSVRVSLVIRDMLNKIQLRCTAIVLGSRDWRSSSIRDLEVVCVCWCALGLHLQRNLRAFFSLQPISNNLWFPVFDCILFDSGTNFLF